MSIWRFSMENPVVKCGRNCIKQFHVESFTGSWIIFLCNQYINVATGCDVGKQTQILKERTEEQQKRISQSEGILSSFHPEEATPICYLKLIYQQLCSHIN
ncbi:hypothetical protein GOODEAATRI_028892 [Goodea atripinnis]|uniref:Uncharacterized protein n=1 Tax=Goodea atripinnis TaxID=208336 RepID=A0ABV0NYT7_9TELE